LPGSILKTAIFGHVFTILLRLVAATLLLPQMETTKKHGRQECQKGTFMDLCQNGERRARN